jgi:hypothetical protein
MDNVVVLFFGRRRFCRHFAHVLDAHAGPIRGRDEVRALSHREDDKNLSGAISWFTFSLQSSEQ